MYARFSLLFLFCLPLLPSVQASQDHLADWSNWSIEGTPDLFYPASEAAFEGDQGMALFLPANEDMQVTATSPLLSLPETGHFRLSWWMRSFHGKSLTVRLTINGDPVGEYPLRSDMQYWSQGHLDFVGEEGDALAIILEADGALGRTSAEVDHFSLRHSPTPFPEVPSLDGLNQQMEPLRLNANQYIFIQRRLTESGPPWPPTLPRTAEDEALLTDADRVGPDGLVYPDWTYAGVPGGIPEAPVVVRAADRGIHPNGEPVGEALQKTIDEIVKGGGGALLLGEGTYNLDYPLVIREDRVVIRGAGRGETILQFSYDGPTDGMVGFANVSEGSTLGPGTPLRLHARTKGLTAMRILGPDGHTIAEHGSHRPEWYFYQEYNRPANFTIQTHGRVLIDRYGPGTHRFTASASYRDQEDEETTLTLHLTEDGDRANARPWGEAAISFHQSGTWNQARQRLVADAPRGSRVIQVDDPRPFHDRAYLVLSVSDQDDWLDSRLIEHPMARGGLLRRKVVGIEEIRDNWIQLKQPLRQDWNADEGVLVIPWQPVRHGGVEDLTIEQTGELWTSGINFNAAAECWVRGVEVIRPGRNPITTWDVKHLEVRDAFFDGAIYAHGGGGTAYVAWQAAYDCLMENVSARKLRHAPNVQWSSSGNVFRNSTFEDSGGQWHAGYTHENLFENITIRTTGSHGAYPFGLYGSYATGMHGPQGPRNVVYGSTIDSWRGGLKVGGTVEGWIFAYNTIEAQRGPAVALMPGTFHATFRGNVLVSHEPDPSLIWIATPDCVDNHFQDNYLIGMGECGTGWRGSWDLRNLIRIIDPESLICPIFSGAGRPLEEEKNRRIADVPSLLPSPQAPVPSIFEWQREN
ncbi:MAG: right-handed parallel beta-helix repeat-containing protein [Opitutales bacterium]|nr:right-handed parallel beta-helix repeat-containing protein [Opitutales bacterium]